MYVFVVLSPIVKTTARQCEVLSQRRGILLSKTCANRKGKYGKVMLVGFACSFGNSNVVIVTC